MWKTEHNERVISVLMASMSEIFQDIQELRSRGGESFNFFLPHFSEILEISYDLLSQITSAQLLIFFFFLFLLSNFTNDIDDVSIYKRYLTIPLDHRFSNMSHRDIQSYRKMKSFFL